MEIQVATSLPAPPNGKQNSNSVLKDDVGCLRGSVPDDVPPSDALEVPRQASPDTLLPFSPLGRPVVADTPKDLDAEISLSESLPGNQAMHVDVSDGSSANAATGAPKWPGATKLNTSTEAPQHEGMHMQADGALPAEKDIVRTVEVSDSFAREHVSRQEPGWDSPLETLQQPSEGCTVSTEGGSDSSTSSPPDGLGGERTDVHVGPCAHETPPDNSTVADLECTPEAHGSSSAEFQSYGGDQKPAVSPPDPMVQLSGDRVDASSPSPEQRRLVRSASAQCCASNSSAVRCFISPSSFLPACFLRHPYSTCRV